MNISRLVGASAIACVFSVVIAQVTPSVHCCKYTYEFEDEGSPPCSSGGTVTTHCEKSSTGTTPEDPDALEDQGSLRSAFCTTFDIGAGGYWANIPCESDPPLGGHYVGELSDGSCCYAVFSGPTDITTYARPNLKVQKCHSSCEGGVE